MGTRRQFSREYKLEAVKLVKERGVSVPQAARDLEIFLTMAFWGVPVDRLHSLSPLPVGAGKSL